MRDGTNACKNGLITTVVFATMIANVIAKIADCPNDGKKCLGSTRRDHKSYK